MGAPIKIKILFQNDDFIAVDKPSGLSVHNTDHEKNLLSLLEEQIKVTKLYPIHRLDKETSGVQLVALHQESAKKLSYEFQKKKVTKTYVGILRGQLKDSEGTWTLKLTDKAEGRKNPQGLSAERLSCETRYKVLKSSKYFTYCQFDLITGRQHQIRKHASLEKQSLVGDQRYGDPKYNKKIKLLYKNHRIFLHSQRIEILGMVFESPVSDEFSALLKD